MRFGNGVDNYLNVLTAQTDLYNGQLVLVSARMQRLTNLVTCIAPLAAGGSSTPATSRVRPMISGMRARRLPMTDGGAGGVGRRAASATWRCVAGRAVLLRAIQTTTQAAKSCKTARAFSITLPLRPTIMIGKSWSLE